MMKVGRMTMARPKVAVENHLHHEDHEDHEDHEENVKNVKNVKNEKSALRRPA